MSCKVLHVSVVCLDKKTFRNMIFITECFVDLVDSQSLQYTGGAECEDIFSVQDSDHACQLALDLLSASPDSACVMASFLHRLHWLRPAFKAGTEAICHQPGLSASLTVHSAAARGLITVGFTAHPGKMVWLAPSFPISLCLLSPTGHTAWCRSTNSNLLYITIIDALEEHLF